MARAASWHVSAEPGTAGAGAAAPDQAAGPPSGADHVWVAATHMSLPDLAPGAVAEVALQVGNA